FRLQFSTIDWTALYIFGGIAAVGILVTVWVGSAIVNRYRAMQEYKNRYIFTTITFGVGMLMLAQLTLLMGSLASLAIPIVAVILNCVGLGLTLPFTSMLLAHHRASHHGIINGARAMSTACALGAGAFFAGEGTSIIYMVGLGGMVAFHSAIFTVKAHGKFIPNSLGKLD
ncbi:hypothetical protein KIPB_007508, partial [Kipferlia bialata]